MKPLPLFSVALFAILGTSALFMNSCGDDSSGIDPDARPIALYCSPTSGTSLVLQEIVRGLSEPLYLDAPQGDPRLFVVEQGGRIVIIKDNIELPTPFLDVSSLIQDQGNEQGLLGLAFHPDYANNGRFFINYTGKAPNGDTVVAEYTASGGADVANPTGKTVLTIAQPQSNHNGGMLTFGVDGYLYIGVGDGGGDDHGTIGNGQDLSTHLGKILRIDVDTGDPYAVPSDNPYVAGGGLEEIWAYGLRNPWRFSFDSDNGEIFIADVGQGAREEVNALAGNVAGANYGWRVAEGSICFNAGTCDTAGMVAPVFDYEHTDGRQSVTGGYVYRGSCIPDIAGWYFFGDYTGEQIYTFIHDAGAATNFQDLTPSIDPNSDVSGLTSFGEDGYGEIYVVSRDGKIFRIAIAP